MYMFIGERPFKCPFEGCTRSFTTSNIRKVHIRIHTGERPYVCNEEGCMKAFASATNYKNHIRIHTGTFVTLRQFADIGCKTKCLSDREGHGHKAVLYKSHFLPLRHELSERHHCIHRLINHVYNKGHTHSYSLPHNMVAARIKH